MQQMTMREIQDVELKILLQFHSVCGENNFRYSLCGGSLIGAVRHKGFIPWDDDIDVIMPRPDYDRFLDYCRQNEVPFGVVSYQSVRGYYGLFAKIWDTSTQVVEPAIKMDYDLGVHIDIFPVDGLGNSKEEALEQYRKTEFWRELLNAVSWKKYERSKTHSVLVEPIRLAMYLMSRAVNPERLLEKIDAVNHSRSFDDCSYCGDVAGSYRKKEIMEKGVFDEYMDIEFENHQVRCLKRYHDFLTNIYGDYMVIPPEEKRVTHHTFTAYRK